MFILLLLFLINRAMLGEGMDEGRRQIISLFATTDEDL
jgi:hypothetical protein